MGAAGILGINEEKAFRHLLILDTLRGEDSTGIAAINSQMGYSIAKEVGTPYALFDTKRCESIFRRLNRVLIGHNRSATSGTVTRKNAHPFDMETIIGVHNGTLKNKYRLDDAADYTVDSENLFHHIEKHSLREAIDLVDGAYALVWWDKFEYELNFLRNEERPLYLARTTDSKTLFWASERWMLHVVCDRNSIKIDEPVSHAIDTHLVFSLNKDGSIGKPKAHEMKSAFIKTPIIQHQNWYGGTGNNGNFSGTRNNVSNVINYPVVNTAVGKATTAGNTEKKSITSTDFPYENYSKELVALCSNRKGVVLKILGTGVDKNKANYVNLFDANYPRVNIRMYVPYNSMLLAMGGRKLTADILGVHQMSGDKPYFLAPMHTHRLIEEDGSVKVKSISTSNFMYDNGKGQLLTKDEWEKLYPNCAWCFDALYAEDHGNRLFTQGDGKYECFCGKCANDPTATEGFILKSVY